MVSSLDMPRFDWRRSYVDGCAGCGIPLSERRESARRIVTNWDDLSAWFEAYCPTCYEDVRRRG